MKLLNGIGLGTWPFANPYSIVTDREASAIVKTFLDSGGKFIDTAPTYGFGRVETLLGRILRGIPRDRYYLSTKCGYVWDANKRLSFSGRYDDVIVECEKSLKRLNVDEIDLYFSHFPDPETPFEETMRAMVDLQKQGKVKELGVSNVNLEQLKEYRKYGSVNFVQNRFSLLNQSLDVDFVAYCLEHEIGVTAVNVINRGLLTDKGVDGMRLREGDQRHQRPEFASEVRQVIGQWVGEHLRPLAESLGTSISALSIWWALQQPVIALCICGATKRAQVISNLQAINLDPPANTLERINASYQVLVNHIDNEYCNSVREFMGLMPMPAETVLRIVRGGEDHGSH